MSGAIPLLSPIYLHGVDREISILTVYNRVPQPFGRDANLCREAILSGSLNSFMIILITNSHYFFVDVLLTIYLSIFIFCNQPT